MSSKMTAQEKKMMLKREAKRKKREERLKRMLKHENYYVNKINFLGRPSELGKNLTSKFLKAIAESGKAGITRQGIERVMKDRKQIDDIKELNFAFDGMQKKNLIHKEQKRNGRYWLTPTGRRQYNSKLAGIFRKQATAINKQFATKRKHGTKPAAKAA